MSEPTTQEKLALSVLQRRYPIAGSSLTHAQQVLANKEAQLSEMGRAHPNHKRLYVEVQNLRIMYSIMRKMQG